MSGGDVRAYRLRPLVLDVGVEGTWVGALPSGPVLQLNGAGEWILGALGAVDDPEPPWRTPAAISAELRAELEDAPADLDDVVAEFLASLAAQGLLLSRPADAAGEPA